MRRLIVVAVVCSGLAAFGADSKEEAQAKIDEAMQQACTLAKKNVADKAAECPDESKALGALDCSDKAARKATDFLALNVTCAKRIKEAAKKTK